MLEHDDLRPDRWSYYEEYLKNRGINKYRETHPQMDDTFVTQVKTEQIKQAMDVRTVLGEVAKAKDKTATKIMQDIIQGTTSIYDGHERFKATGKASNGYQRIKKFRDLIDDDFQKVLLLEAATTKSVIFELKKIQKAVNKLINDMGK